MKTLKICVLAILVSSLARSSEGAQVAFDLDLANDGGTFSVPVDVEPKVVILNRLPDRAYSVDIVKENVLHSLIPLQGLAAAGFGIMAAPVVCQNLVGSLYDAKSEIGVKTAIATAKASPNYRGCQHLVDPVIDATTFNHTYTGQLVRGEQLKITIKRSKDTQDDPKEAKTWEFILTTGPRGSWLTHYGFTFLPHRDEAFFTKEVVAAASPADGVEPTAGDAASTTQEEAAFAITEKVDRGGEDFEPTILFTYVPERHKYKTLIPKFTAGVGADIEQRLVFVGLSWLIGDNVDIFFGVAGHKQSRLKGIYEPGEVVKEALQEDQLVDDTFDRNAIFGIGIRFDGNPFKKKDSSKSDEE